VPSSGIFANRIWFHLKRPKSDAWAKEEGCMCHLPGNFTKAGMLEFVFVYYYAHGSAVLGTTATM